MYYVKPQFYPSCSPPPEGGKEQDEKCKQLEAAYEHHDRKKPLDRTWQTGKSALRSGGPIAESVTADT